MTSTYKPDIKIYYGSISPNNRLVPAPDITISIDHNYSNDSIIGYTYVFNLSGSATALDLRNVDYGDEYSEPDNYNLGAVVDHIHKLRNILSKNGDTLYIVNGETDSIILKASGGILRSFAFDQSNNNWTHYATYTASIEFNLVDFMSSTESCDSVFLDPNSFPTNTAGIADINQFKIKSFSDTWSFNFNENDSYSRVKIIETGDNLDLNNVSFEIEYSINAVGKHFYIDSKVLPAWEQAKNFVQYRLHAQVTNLLNNVLKNPYIPCSSSDGLDDIHTPGSNGLLLSLGDGIYKIYNEEIACETSESEGSFSATYSAIVVTTLGNKDWSANGAKHTVNKSVKTNIDQTGKKTKTISIDGTIQGLIEGGLIRINQVLELPSQGAIRLLNNISDSKYNNAKNVLDKIYSDSDYNSGFGQCGKRDLKPAFKNILGITIDALQTNNQPPDPNNNASCNDGSTDSNCIIPDPPHPISFNLTHNYNDATITYSVEYDSSNSNCTDGGNAKFTQISIQTSKPTKVFATFDIPNSQSCPVIQELGTYTAQLVNVTIAGTDPSCIGKPEVVDFETLINCGSCDSNEYLPVNIPMPEGDFILRQKQYTSNPVDGSFTINLGYICGVPGCILPQ